MQLPEEFISYTRGIFGEERWQHFLDSFEEETPVSIRLNPWKSGPSSFDHIPAIQQALDDESCRVPWCRNGYYLKDRPNFTMDPLLHAGCYYVQEASSMFLDEILRQLLPEDSLPTSEGQGVSFLPLPNREGRGGSLLPHREGRGGSLLPPLFGEGWGGAALDLCAAPGGKSTLLRATLPDDCVLYSNEPDRRRANILMENLQKQGHPRVYVTNNYAKDYRRAKMMFDLILCDVPCSGEGMFRKDEGAIGEWSLKNVMACAELQRSIVEDIWPCLTDGGIMIYSTCTFNLHEDEENVRWICETLGAEIIDIHLKPEWNITGSLLPGWEGPVYRFIPGTTKGEGMFMAVLRKTLPPTSSSYVGRESDYSTTDDNYSEKVFRGREKAKGSVLPPYREGRGGSLGGASLRLLSDGNPKGTPKGKDIIPAHAEALLINLPEDKYQRAELSLDDALRYLHHEAIVLSPDIPRGFTIVTYQGYPLGFVKNIGNRANNLYPQEWKIRNDLSPRPHQ